MTARKDSDGNTINKKVTRRVTTSPSGDVHVGDHANSLVDLALGQDALSAAVGFFTEHDNGYLKVRRALDSQDLHLTWTWSVGTWRGSYVYARVEYWRVSFGLELLQSKVLDVEDGLRKPSPDKRMT